MITKAEGKCTTGTDQCRRIADTPGGQIHASIYKIKRIGSN